MPPSAMADRGATRIAWKPLLYLMVLVPLLTEVVTGSTPIHGFLDPMTVLLAIIGYCLPVLVVRAWAVRFKLGFPALFALGVAFGLFNEGLGSKTAILTDALPIVQFTSYGRWLDVNFPWIASIGLYQALAAVCLPILFVHHRFPDQRHQPWISHRVTVALTIVLLLIGCGFFLSPVRIQGTPVQMAIILAMMAAAVVLALVLPRSPDTWRGSATSPSLAALLFGLSIVSASVLLPALAAQAVPVWLYAVVFACGAGFYIWVLKRKGWDRTPNLTLFGLGFYMQSAAIGLLVGIAGGSLPMIVSGTILEAAFLFAALRIRFGGRSG